MSLSFLTPPQPKGVRKSKPETLGIYRSENEIIILKNGLKSGT